MTREQMREKCGKLALQVGVATLNAQEGNYAQYRKAVDALEAFARDIRNDALEEALTKCETFQKFWKNDLVRSDAARTLKLNIRALKESANG